MVKTILLAVLFFITLNCYASQVVCEGWYQIPGGDLQRNQMPIISETEKNTIFLINNNGYNYRVDWDKELTSFYISIEFNGQRILFTTARVPTVNHPENFTDLNLPNGPRLSVNCEMKSTSNHE